MMKWRPWPPLQSKKVEVKLVVKRLDGLWSGDGQKMGVVEIRWKGPKIGLGSFRRSVKKNVTKQVGVDQNGVFQWDEEFFSVCALSAYKDDAFHPWEISFTVFNVSVFNTLSPFVFLIYFCIDFLYVFDQLECFEIDG